MPRKPTSRDLTRSLDEAVQACARVELVAESLGRPDIESIARDAGSRLMEHLLPLIPSAHASGDSGG